MEYRETCDMKTCDLREKPMLGIDLWKPILRTGLGKETYPEDRFNGISVHFACSLIEILRWFVKPGLSLFTCDIASFK